LKSVPQRSSSTSLVELTKRLGVYVFLSEIMPSVAACVQAIEGIVVVTAAFVADFYNQ